MPQPDLPFEGDIKIDATRLKPAFVLAFWRQNGANFLRNLLSPPYRNLWTSKTTLILRFFENTFWAASLLATRDCTQLALLPPYSNMEDKKRHGLSKNLSTKLPKPAPLKKRHLFFAFLLRWSAVADSGVIFSALSSTPVPHGFEAKSKHRAEKFPSTPVPQHPKPKSKHRIEIFFEKPSIPVPQHRAENFQHQLQKCCECPSLSYRNIGGQ